MPRAKVPDDRRQRAAEACSYCRETKKRCSGTVPCTHCQRRGLAGECAITYLPRGSRAKQLAVEQRADLSHTSRRHRSTSAASMPGATGIPGTSFNSNMVTQPQAFEPLSPSVSRASNDYDGLFPANEAGASTTNATSTTREADVAAVSPRMLLSSHGEKGTQSLPRCFFWHSLTDTSRIVYIGAGASIAFLQTVRRVVSEQIGPSDFSRGKDNERMLEIQAEQQIEAITSITVEQRARFMSCFLAVVSAFQFSYLTSISIDHFPDSSMDGRF